MDEKRSWILTFLLLMVFSAVVFAAPIYKALQPPPLRTAWLQEGKIEEAWQGEALLVRQEESLNISLQSQVYPLVSSGRRIAAGQVLLRTGPDASLSAYNAWVDAKDKLTAAVLKSERDAGRPVSLMSQNWQDRLRDLCATQGLPFYSAVSEIDALGTLMSSRADEILQSGKGFEAEKKTVSQAEDAFIKATQAVSVSGTGWFAAGTDGWENKIRQQDIFSMSPAKFRDNIAKAPDKADQKGFRIIRDLAWYVVMELPEDALKSRKLEETAGKVRLSDGQEFTVTLSYRSIPDQNRVVVALKSSQQVPDYEIFRKTTVHLIKSMQKGLKVPLSAITGLSSDKTSGTIKMVSGGYVKEKAVKLIASDDHFGIIDNADKQFSMYDIYITDPQKAYEGEAVSQ